MIENGVAGRISALGARTEAEIDALWHYLRSVPPREAVSRSLQPLVLGRTPLITRQDLLPLYG